MNKKRIEILVGLFVVLGLLGMLFLALKAANLASFGRNQTYTVTAAFDNIGGLKPRAAVRSAGVVVGRVTSIKLDPKTYKGLVTMELSEGVHFPEDSSAKILTSGLLGDQYVGIEPGGTLASLAAGSMIKETQSAVVLEDLISQMLFSRAADAGTAPPSLDGSLK
ncbi:outer membrane lipid asymmetry maintenance protein MlaD [Aquincola sp. MAHUQ-54]|uniref:Outer membrane lipid asymmetry maintenance protein MlaD n=1 Tax=Aquincola agrisoli TaxID=3119538 RepID=A0AAW9QLE8_9BURK